MAYPLDVTALPCLFLGVFALTFGLWSRVIKENLFLSEPILCTLWGILLSNNVLGILDYIPEGWDQGLAHNNVRDSLLWLCRIVIGLQVLFAASTLPGRWLGQNRNLQSMVVLLLPVMTIGWLMSSGLVKVCFPAMSWTESLIIGACIAPTDPVLANSVVKGTFAERHVPLSVRQLLLAESGLNDGFGTPFLFVPISAILNDFHSGDAIKAFVFETVLYDVIFGSALGVGIGCLARNGMKVARKNEWIDRESMMIFLTALALFTIGLGQSLGTNGLLACFFAGIAVAWTDATGVEDLYHSFSEGVELLLNSVVFFVLGVILPLDTWRDPNFLPLPNLVLLGVLILALRRLPAIMMMYKIIPVFQTINEAAFAGYFGPIGVSALYYALIASEKLPDDYTERNSIVAATTFIIFSSIVVHGTSAPLYALTRSLVYSFATKSSATRYHDDHEAPVQDEDGETAPLLGGRRRRSVWVEICACMRRKDPQNGPEQEESEGRLYSERGDS